MISEPNVISGNTTIITRKRPFCAKLVQDKRQSERHFIVHLRSPLAVHKRNDDWAGYVGQDESRDRDALQHSD